jgi:LysM repeat protein
MNKRLAIISILIILAAPACSRSASKAPTATPTSLVFEINTLPAAKAAETGLPTSTTPQAQATQAAPAATTVSGTSQLTIPGSNAEVTGTAVPVVYPTYVTTRPTSYTLQSGEFPYCIARRFNLDVAALMTLNNLSNNSQVAPGTTLQIPQTGDWDGGSRALVPHPATYTVGSGETVYSIACHYGDVDPNAIIIANNLASETLTTGQVLNIP